ncbi:hypothetical protein E1B28_008218 [Marasmius oreades]|uniref:Uncharacterized protein n=1 Tax=Marasmius oreades TaxID=181124 RepID=A0A9P7RY21_9AGAR|nr:uncharacterized protein E1B28_008218 [Marasmius oreades]KAG7091815.1 hypothetical protein E1B28_008218 [Marasmius oreades]
MLNTSGLFSSSVQSVVNPSPPSPTPPTDRPSTVTVPSEVVPSSPVPAALIVRPFMLVSITPSGSVVAPCPPDPAPSTVTRPAPSEPSIQKLHSFPEMSADSLSRVSEASDNDNSEDKSDKGRDNTQGAMAKVSNVVCGEKRGVSRQSTLPKVKLEILECSGTIRVTSISAMPPDISSSRDLPAYLGPEKMAEFHNVFQEYAKTLYDEEDIKNRVWDDPSQPPTIPKVDDNSNKPPLTSTSSRLVVSASAHTLTLLLHPMSGLEERGIMSSNILHKTSSASSMDIYAESQTPEATVCSPPNQSTSFMPQLSNPLSSQPMAITSGLEPSSCPSITSSQSASTQLATAPLQSEATPLTASDPYPATSTPAEKSVGNSHMVVSPQSMHGISAPADPSSTAFSLFLRHPSSPFSPSLFHFKYMFYSL